MPVLVSACLLGFPCRHDGAHKLDARVIERLRGEEVVPICPEAAGGRATPRPAAWHDGKRIVDSLGRDVTAQFEKGAHIALDAAKAHGVHLALLKQNSP